MVEESHITQKIWLALNTTFLTPIPKENKPSTPNEFLPIAPCNVLDKIITKIIANYLNPLLPSLISVEQTGYVEGQQILDGIYWALIYWCKSNLEFMSIRVGRLRGISKYKDFKARLDLEI